MNSLPESLIGTILGGLLVALVGYLVGRPVLQVWRFRSIVLHGTREKRMAGAGDALRRHEQARTLPADEILDFSGDAAIQLDIEMSPAKNPDRPLVTRVD